MSIATKKAAPIYLREARLAAGYANRDTASMGVPFSPETIGRHERGEVPIMPEDVVVYANGYRRNDILVRYCACCPVGKARGKRVTERDLPFATLRLTKRLRLAAKEIADNLERIADDGSVKECQLDDFMRAMSFILTLKEAIYDMELYAATQGIRKEPPHNGNGPQQP